MCADHATYDPSFTQPPTHPLLDGVSQRLYLRARWRLPQPDVVGHVVLLYARTRLALLCLVGVYASSSSLLVLVVDVFVDLVEGALVVKQMMVVDVGPDSAADDDARGAVEMRIYAGLVEE